MARWALTPVIGNGTGRIVAGQEETTGPYRSAAADYGAHTAVIPGNDDGTPRFGWCLVRVPTAAEIIAANPDMPQDRQDKLRAAYAALQADGRLRLLPDWTLDHVVTAGEAAGIANALDHFGISGYPNPTGRTVRQVVRWIADKLDVTWQAG